MLAQLLVVPPPAVQGTLDSFSALWGAEPLLKCRIALILWAAYALQMHWHM